MNQYGYYPMYNPYAAAYTPTAAPTAPTTSASTGINWVLGAENAKSFYVEPGKSAILMDSEKQMFYIKSVDPSGMATFKTYTFAEYTEPTTTTPTFDPTKFVTKDELATVLESLRQKLPENKALI